MKAGKIKNNKVKILLIALIIWSFMGVIGASTWPYLVNSWLLVAGKETVIVWWQGFLMGLIPGVGQLAIPVSLLTFIILLFL